MKTRKTDSLKSEDLRKKYSELKKFETISLEVENRNFAKASLYMEAAGFAAITINLNHEPPTISGTRAKDGECYETGRTAFYKGSATAALDDDNHLIFKELRVCEKTASVYKLPQYANIVEISDGHQDLIKKLDTEPQLFDCNTYEEDFQRLISILTPPSGNGGNNIDFIYTGPFRALILNDGTVLRRGEEYKIPEELAKNLVSEGGHIIESGPSEATAPSNLIELYEDHGSGILMGDFCPKEINSEKEIDFSIFSEISEQLKHKIQRMISNADRYFILTGSSPSDPDGCCPSLEVGEGEKLVKAGILCSFLKPAPPDSCPVTIFSINGEISAENGAVRFSENRTLRNELSKILKN